MNNKYYWLKLNKDFFKRHDTTIIESMPNGKDYIIFYLKLLCESIDHEGKLRFSEEIPYNEEMLATITRTNVDVVRSAIKVFTQLNMIEVLDDGTYFMSKVDKMIGFESEWAKKKRDYRETQEELKKLQVDNVPLMSYKREEIEKDKEKVIKENNLKEKSSRFIAPTIEEIRNYCKVRNNNIDPEAFYNFYESKGWYVGKNKMKNWKCAIITWEKSRKPSFNNRETNIKQVEYTKDYDETFDSRIKKL